MDRYVRQASSTNIQNFKDLSPDHELYQFLRQFFIFIRNSGIPVQHMQTFTEKVVLALYESDSALVLEAYTVFLQIILELYPMLAKEVVGWLVYADDEVCNVKQKVSESNKVGKKNVFMGTNIYFMFSESIMLK